MQEKISELRRNMRRIELRVKEFFSKQIPTEIFHYTLSQMRAIDTLYALNHDSGNGIHLKMLAEKLNITPAAASEMVDTLVRKGAIIRKNDPADRRAVRLFVGENLQKRFEICEKQLDELTTCFLSTLSEDEGRIFMDVIRKYAEFTDDPENFPEVVK